MVEREKNSVGKEIKIDDKRYVLHEDIGSGAYGKVYRATRLKKKRPVAVKIFKEDAKSFMKEITILSKLDHPNIVSLLHSGVWQGDFEEKFCMVMPFIEGQNLRDYCELHKPPKVRLILELIIQVARAIGYAHNFQEGQVIHRDLKPENILIDDDGQLYIVDFGIAHVALDEQTTFTNSLGEKGTPDYMAPEQLLNEVDTEHFFRCDIWALGVILFELLEGRRPFQGSNYLELGNSITNDPLPPLVKIKSPQIQSIIEKALQKDRSFRYPTAEAFADDLSLYLREKYQATFTKKRGQEPILKVLAPSHYRNKKNWVQIRDNLQKCESLSLPLISAKPLTIGHKTYPSEVWLAYPKPSGYPLREIKGTISNEHLEELMEKIVIIMYQLREIGFQPKLPEKGSIYWCPEKGWQILLEEWAFMFHNSTPEINQIVEILKYASAENVPLQWKNILQGSGARNLGDWLEKLRKESVIAQEFDEILEKKDCLVKGPLYQAEEIAKRIAEAFWSDSVYLQDRAGEIIPTLKRQEDGTVEALVEIIDEEPSSESEVIRYWEFPLGNGEVQTVWLLRCPNKTQATKPIPEEIDGFEFLQEKTYSENGINQRVKEYKHLETELEFILIPGGYFQMGSREGSVEGKTPLWEKPFHWVELSPFLISKYLVTQKIWFKVTGKKPSVLEGKHHPVENVSWDDCQNFCQEVGLQLPTEAQWEYACRAGSSTNYYWGNGWQEDKINSGSFWTGRSYPQTTKVGEFPPNAFGLYDMLGNVWEWCQDTWQGTYKGAPEDGVAWEDEDPEANRIYRGGCYWSNPSDCRSAHRSWGDCEQGLWDIGFRVVKNLD